MQVAVNLFPLDNLDIVPERGFFEFVERIGGLVSVFGSVFAVSYVGDGLAVPACTFSIYILLLV